MNRTDGMVMEGRPMNRTVENPYMIAGWLAIASAALLLPAMVLSVFIDIIFQRSHTLPLGLAMVYFLVAVGQALCSLYALYRFRDYINEYYDFHETDGLVTCILIGAIAMTSVALVGKVVAWSGGELSSVIAFLGLMLLVGIPLSVVSIIFAVKLLHLPSDLGGLLKPIVAVNIIACVCFLLVVLAPVGLLLSAVGDALLAMVFLRQAGKNDGPEFV